MLPKLPEIPQEFVNEEDYKRYIKTISEELNLAKKTYKNNTSDLKDKESKEFLLSEILEQSLQFCRRFRNHLNNLDNRNFREFKTREDKNILQSNIKKFDDAVKKYITNREEFIKKHRAYVPQQYAGILIDNPELKYLETTTGLQPCVGLCICVPDKVAVVAHFDNDNYSNKTYIPGAKPQEKEAQEKQQQKEQLKDCIKQLLEKVSEINLENNPLQVTIVKSEYPHEGLDDVINEIMQELGHNAEIKLVARDDATLICDIKTGKVYTYDYKEEPFEEKSSKQEIIKDALGLPENFKLYNIANNQFVLQDLDGKFIWEHNAMQPKNKSEQMDLDVSSTSPSPSDDRLVTNKRKQSKVPYLPSSPSETKRQKTQEGEKQVPPKTTSSETSSPQSSKKRKNRSSSN